MVQVSCKSKLLLSNDHLRSSLSHQKSLLARYHSDTAGSENIIVFRYELNTVIKSQFRLDVKGSGKRFIHILAASEIGFDKED